MKLTSRQSEYLEYMHLYFTDNDQLPSVSALASGMGVTENAAHEAIKRLSGSGYIERNEAGKWRFTRIKAVA